MSASISWRFFIPASAIRSIVPVRCCARWLMPGIWEESQDAGFINTDGVRSGPVLAVEVGSYRYDPLSELHHPKPVEPGILLEMRLQAARGFGPDLLRLADGIHGRTRPGKNQRDR